MSAKIRLAGGAIAFGVLLAGSYHLAAEYHLGAPLLRITCVPPDHPVTSWVPDSDLSRITGPGSSTPANTVHWLGWTEVGGCGESITITTGAR